MDDENASITGAIGPQYYVHYKGWKEKWNEWVPAERLLKKTPENLKLQASLKAAHPHLSGRGPGQASSGLVKSWGGSAISVKKRGRKRRREQDEGNRKLDNIRVNVPSSLKHKLVQDRDAITINSQLVPLPRVPTAFDILNSFSDSILSTKPPHLIEPNLVLPTIISGLQCYFDRACGPNLIYANERAQFAEVRKQYWTGPKVIVGQEKEMSLIYGAEHLLRMLMVFPMMIVSSELDDGSIQILRDYIDELLLYMERERENIFLSEYQSGDSVNLCVSKPPARRRRNQNQE